jgi:hypothetical protein
VGTSVTARIPAADVINDPAAIESSEVRIVQRVTGQTQLPRPAPQIPPQRGLQLLELQEAAEAARMARLAGQAARAAEAARAAQLAAEAVAAAEAAKVAGAAAVALLEILVIVAIVVVVVVVILLVIDALSEHPEPQPQPGPQPPDLDTGPEPELEPEPEPGPQPQPAPHPLPQDAPDGGSCPPDFLRINWPPPLWMGLVEDSGSLSSTNNRPPPIIARAPRGRPRDQSLVRRYRRNNAVQLAAAASRRIHGHIHHKWPLYLSGPDTYDNLVFFQTDMHTTWHNSLARQSCGYLPNHPTGTLYCVL